MRNAGVERVGGVGLQAEVVREDPLPDEPGDAAAAGCRSATSSADRPACARRSAPATQSSSSATASPSVPLDFFIR